MGRPSSELPGQKTEAGVLSTGSAVSLPLTPRRTPGPPRRDTAVTTVLSPGSLRPEPFGLQAQTVLSPLLSGRLKSFLNFFFFTVRLVQRGCCSLLHHQLRDPTYCFSPLQQSGATRRPAVVCSAGAVPPTRPCNTWAAVDKQLLGG